MLYHLSRRKLYDGGFLTPRLPDLMRDEEFSLPPRICFSDSIDGCLKAAISRGVGRCMYVYVLKDSVKTYKPTIKQVADCKITNEVWVNERIHVEYAGKILPTKLLFKEHYKNYKAEFDYPVYRWKWIEKIEGVLE